MEDKIWIAYFAEFYGAGSGSSFDEAVVIIRAPDYSTAEIEAKLWETNLKIDLVSVDEFTGTSKLAMSRYD